MDRLQALDPRRVIVRPRLARVLADHLLLDRRVPGRHALRDQHRRCLAQVAISRVPDVLAVHVLAFLLVHDVSPEHVVLALVEQLDARRAHPRRVASVSAPAACFAQEHHLGEGGVDLEGEASVFRVE